MNDNTNYTTGGISFFSMLGIVFIVLKLTHVIDWKWIWVLSPLWIQAAVGLIFLVVWIVVSIIIRIKFKE